MRRLLVPLAAFLVLFACAPARAEAVVVPNTLLVYMIGADLEENGYASADIQEMLAASLHTQNMRILLLAGGADPLIAGLESENGAVYRIERGTMTREASLDVGAMGEADTLARFVAFGQSSAPAATTGLIFWDHGYGPMEGFGLDAQNGGDRLTLFEIADALEKVNKLDYIGFDACLMASAETAGVLAPYADYLIASQETEPGGGWDYSFLTAVREDAQALEICSLIADAYIAYYETLYADYPDFMPLLSLTCVNLRQMDALDEAMDALFREMAAGLAGGAYSDIVRARRQPSLGRVHNGHRL